MHRLAVVALGSLWLLGGLGDAAAQDLPTLAPKTEPRPYGYLAPAAQVSAARIVVGVAAPGPVSEAKPDLVAVLPAVWSADPICARLISPDALFEGRAEYTVPKSRKGDLVKLGDGTNDAPWFTAEHWSKLRDSDVAELAFAVTRGECSLPSTEFTIAGLSSGSASLGGTIAIYVNSQGAERVFAEIRKGAGDRSMILCDPSEAQSTVGYDRLCTFEAAPDDGVVEVRINRVNFGAYEDPVDLTIITTAID